MELLDLYDDNCKKLNEEITRGEELKVGKNVMLSVIFIKNKENKYLIQKTSKEKGGKFLQPEDMLFMEKMDLQLLKEN